MTHTRNVLLVPAGLILMGAVLFVVVLLRAQIALVLIHLIVCSETTAELEVECALTAGAAAAAGAGPNQLS